MPSTESKNGERLKSSQVSRFAWSVPVTRLWTNMRALASGSYRPMMLVAAIGTINRPIRSATEDGTASRIWWIVTIGNAFDNRTPRNCSEADVAGARAATSSAIRIESWEDEGEAGDGRGAEEEGTTSLSRNGERSSELYHSSRECHRC